MLKGIGASEGIGIGKALKLLNKPIVYEDISPSDPTEEKKRFESAVKSFATETKKGRNEWTNSVPTEKFYADIRQCCLTRICFHR